MKDQRIKDFVSLYEAPKTPPPFFGFITYNHGNRGWIKKKQFIELENKRLDKIKKNKQL